MADSTVASLTALAALAGDELLYCVDDPAGTPLNRKVTANQLRAGLMRPSYMALAGGTNGGYLGHPTFSPVAGACSNNLLYTHLLMVPADMTLTELAIDVTTGASGDVRLGIYNLRAEHNALPGTLILDAGTASVSVTNSMARVTGLSQSLRRGWYAVASVLSVAATMFRAGGGIDGYVPTGSATGALCAVSRAFTYGTLPADESAETYAGANAPAIFAKGTFS